MKIFNSLHPFAAMIAPPAAYTSQTLNSFYKIVLTQAQPLLRHKFVVLSGITLTVVSALAVLRVLKRDPTRRNEEKDIEAFPQEAVKQPATAIIKPDTLDITTVPDPKALEQEPITAAPDPKALEQKPVTATLKLLLIQPTLVGHHNNHTLTEPFGTKLQLNPNDQYLSCAVTDLNTPQAWVNSPYPLRNTELLIVPSSFFKKKKSGDWVELKYGGVLVHFQLKDWFSKQLPQPTHTYFIEDLVPYPDIGQLNLAAFTGKDNLQPMFLSNQYTSPPPNAPPPPSWGVAFASNQMASSSQFLGKDWGVSEGIAGGRLSLQRLNYAPIEDLGAFPHMSSPTTYRLAFGQSLDLVPLDNPPEAVEMFLSNFQSIPESEREIKQRLISPMAVSKLVESPTDWSFRADLDWLDAAKVWLVTSPGKIGIVGVRYDRPDVTWVVKDTRPVYRFASYEMSGVDLSKITVTKPNPNKHLLQVSIPKILCSAK